MIALPSVVHNTALSIGAGEWVTRLDDLVASLTTDWGLALGRMHTNGTEALVLDATLDDGTEAVLKIAVPRGDDSLRHEALVLELADGHGCPRLLRHDLERGALLLERLGRPLLELGLPTRRRQEIICAAAQQMWVPVPDADLPSGAEKGRWLQACIEEWWEQFDRPCSERAVEHALACAEHRIAAHDDELAVLVHGDAHQWNTLEAGDGFKLVDPDGLRAEAAYDPAISMREDSDELLAGDALSLGQERAQLLASLTGLDPVPIWEWGVVERMSSSLLCLGNDDLLGYARDALKVSERWAEG